MKTNTPIFFTYLIGWTGKDKWYYGVRYAKNSHPDSLWTTYFTSSKIIIGFRKKYGEPDIVKIRRTFTEKQKALLWEQKVLKRLKIPFNEKWLNANVGGYCGDKKYIENKINIENKRKRLLINNPMKNSESRKKLSLTRKQKGLGSLSAKYLKPHTGNSNPMKNPEILANYKKLITGRTRVYREDGSWHWSTKK